MFGSGSVTAVPNLFGTRDHFTGRQFFHGRRWGDGGVGNGSGGNASNGGDGSGGNASDGE